MVRSYRRTYVYVSREYLFSFAVAFLFFFFIFFLNQILVMAEEIFSKKVPFWDVLLLVIYSLPIVIAFSFPFGSLVGALMAVGRMSSDNELLAFGALGVPSRHLVIPLLAVGLAFSLVSFIMNDYFLPLGNIRFAEIYRRILYSNPAVELESHSIKKYENTTIITGQVEGRRIKDLLIIDKSPEGNRRIITARDAHLEESRVQRGVVSLTLDGVITEVSYPSEGDRYDYTTSQSMVYNILLKDISVSMGGINPSYQSSVDVWREIRAKQADQEKAVEDKDARVRELQFRLASGVDAAALAAQADPSQAGAARQEVADLWREYSAEKGRNVTDQTLQAYLLEFYRKFSMPAACLVFAYFAFPIGVRARRSGRTVGFAVGLFVSIVYWGMLFAGQTFGVRMSLSPAFSMWFPDAIVLFAALA
ncbi:MAG TPA: LptF/LptG family permease, partial [Spirochaetia bacterium]|nr:LptF/LptG family permease [Spirochaetia bacterium]